MSLPHRVAARSGAKVTQGVRMSAGLQSPLTPELAGLGLITCVRSRPGRACRAGTLPMAALPSRGRSSMAEPQPSKLVMRVRFPSPARTRNPRSAVLSTQGPFKIRKPCALGVPVACPMADGQFAAWRPSETPREPRRSPHRGHGRRGDRSARPDPIMCLPVPGRHGSGRRFAGSLIPDRTPWSDIGSSSKRGMTCR